MLNYLILAFQEYKACLIFNQNITNDPSTKKKLLKRCDLTLKYLKNIQISLCNIMENKSCKFFFKTFLNLFSSLFCHI